MRGRCRTRTRVVIRASPERLREAVSVKEAVRFLGFDAEIVVDQKASLVIVIDGVPYYDDSYALSMLIEKRGGKQC